jgi:hypothetical protein
MLNGQSNCRVPLSPAPADFSRFSKALRGEISLLRLCFIYPGCEEHQKAPEKGRDLVSRIIPFPYSTTSKDKGSYLDEKANKNRKKGRQPTDRVSGHNQSSSFFYTLYCCYLHHWSTTSFLEQIPLNFWISDEVRNQ